MSLLLIFGSGLTALAAGEGAAAEPSVYQTFWSLLPPIVAIALALITKEVYTSLFVGIVVGGLLYSNFNPEGTLLHVFNDGIVASASDSYNVGILVFLIALGILVIMMGKPAARRPSEDGRKPILKPGPAPSWPPSAWAF